MRYLSLIRINETTGQKPSDRLMQEMGKLIDEMQTAGVLQATGGLASTKKGARIRYEGGKPSVIDGPFAESKEMLGG